MKAFVLDPPRCTGCEACRVACSIENRVPIERSWRTIHHVNPEHVPGLATFHLALACNHCTHPACLEGCPASAYSRNPATGAVLLNATRCLGCRYCSWVCPYDAPRFDAAAGVMSKCTFCNDRLLVGNAPACAVACPTGALGVEDLRGNLPEPEFPGLFQGGLGPALRIESALVPTAPLMAAACTADGAAWIGGPPAMASGKISLRSEWTLWLFTLVAMTLVGFHLGWAIGGPRLLPPWAFLSLGGLAGALSTSHLGRPERAWRALANLRTSWLSREILAFGVFLPAAVISQALGVRGPLSWCGVASGLFLLFSMDRLYQIAERRSLWRIRSADVLPTALHLVALVFHALPALWLMASLRTALFVAGLLRRPRREGEVFSAVVRVAALAVPVLLVTSGLPVPAWALLGCFLAGEALDRAGFYDDLKIPAPSLLMNSDGASSTSGSAGPA